MRYRNVEIVDIPSGLGGTLPAAIFKHNNNGTSCVLCLHQEYYPNWILDVQTDKIKPASYRLSDFAKRCIDKRLS